METNCKNCPFNSKAATTLCETSFEQLSANHLVLKFKKGEIIGFRGESGSGKSTLINLLLGFLKPTSGYILVDNKNIEKSLLTWQSKIAYVPQEVILFDDTIKNNIIFYDDTIKLKDIETILKELKLENLIDNSSKGLDTLIGEDGSFLSGGQKQRIGIARAVLRKPALIIFDESTSAVDSDTENAINQVIKNISSECIVIIIAHKSSAFAECSQIFRIKNNKFINEKR